METSKPRHIPATQIISSTPGTPLDLSLWYSTAQPLNAAKHLNPQSHVGRKEMSWALPLHCGCYAKHGIAAMSQANISKPNQ
jgi:hypothetical protein